MIWSVAQVRAMESYRFTQAVDMFLVERAQVEGGPNPVIEATVDHLFAGLQAAGHTWGLEIHKDDLEVDIVPNPDGHMLDLVRARWAPTTRKGLLIGGPAGGTCQTFDDYLHRRGIAVQVIDHRAPRDMWIDQDAVAGTIVAPVVDQLYYSWCGWTEIRRMWVYSVGR